MTEREQREWWGMTHRKQPSPEEARTAGWIERDGRWQTHRYWLARDRLDALGFMEVLPDYYVRGSIRTQTAALQHETVPDFSEYPGG